MKLGVQELKYLKVNANYKILGGPQEMWAHEDQLRRYLLPHVSFLYYLSLEGKLWDMNIKISQILQIATIQLEIFTGKHQSSKLIFEDWLTEENGDY